MTVTNRYSTLDLDAAELKARYIWAIQHYRSCKHPEQKEFFKKEIDECAFAAEQKHNLILERLNEFI